MLPICYENGLTGHDAECPTFMNIATETYIKEALSNFFQRVSSNGPGYIKTADYKRKVAKEEDKVASGELVRTAGGLLPIEQEELRKRRPLCMEDLRMAMVLGDGYLGQTPCIWGTITNGHFLDTPGVEEGENEERDRLRNGSLAATAAANTRMHRKPKVDTDYYGYNIDLGEPGVVMDDDWTWTGAGVQDVQALDAVLDQCLAVGT
jgi:transcriptional coactivator HFI1/ADA1